MRLFAAVFNGGSFPGWVLVPTKARRTPEAISKVLIAGTAERRKIINARRPNLPAFPPYRQKKIRKVSHEGTKNTESFHYPYFFVTLWETTFKLTHCLNYFP